MFDLDMMGSSIDDMINITWSGDIAYVSGNSKVMHAEIASASCVAKNNDWSKKLEKIRWLVVSGRYKIDAEKLAEKMLGSMLGFAGDPFKSLPNPPFVSISAPGSIPAWKA
jgi:hypothetical protein